MLIFICEAKVRTAFIVRRILLASRFMQIQINEFVFIKIVSKMMICKSLHAHAHTRALCISHRRFTQNSRTLRTLSRTSPEKGHVTWDSLHLGTMPLAGLEMLPWVPPVVQLHSFVVLSSSETPHEVRFVISQSLLVVSASVYVAKSQIPGGTHTQFRCLTCDKFCPPTSIQVRVSSPRVNSRRKVRDTVRACSPPHTARAVLPVLYFKRVLRPWLSFCLITARLLKHSK